MADIWGSYLKGEEIGRQEKAKRTAEDQTQQQIDIAKEAQSGRTKELKWKETDRDNQIKTGKAMFDATLSGSLQPMIDRLNDIYPDQNITYEKAVDADGNAILKNGEQLHYIYKDGKLTGRGTHKEIFNGMGKWGDLTPESFKASQKLATDEQLFRIKEKERVAGYGPLGGEIKTKDLKEGQKVFERRLPRTELEEIRQQGQTARATAKAGRAGAAATKAGKWLDQLWPTRDELNDVAGINRMGKEVFAAAYETAPNKDAQTILAQNIMPIYKTVLDRADENGVTEYNGQQIRVNNPGRARELLAEIVKVETGKAERYVQPQQQQAQTGLAQAEQQPQISPDRREQFLQQQAQQRFQTPQSTLGLGQPQTGLNQAPVTRQQLSQDIARQRQIEEAARQQALRDQAARQGTQRISPDYLQRQQSLGR
jgi:hypothetical protein